MNFVYENSHQVNGEKVSCETKTHERFGVTQETDLGPVFFNIAFVLAQNSFLQV